MENNEKKPFMDSLSITEKKVFEWIKTHIKESIIIVLLLVIFAIIL